MLLFNVIIFDKVKDCLENYFPLVAFGVCVWLEVAAAAPIESKLLDAWALVDVDPLGSYGPTPYLFMLLPLFGRSALMVELFYMRFECFVMATY